MRVLRNLPFSEKNLGLSRISFEVSRISLRHVRNSTVLVAHAGGGLLRALGCNFGRNAYGDVASKISARGIVTETRGFSSNPAKSIQEWLWALPLRQPGS